MRCIAEDCSLKTPALENDLVGTYVLNLLQSCLAMSCLALLCHTVPCFVQLCTALNSMETIHALPLLLLFNHIFYSFLFIFSGMIYIKVTLHLPKLLPQKNFLYLQFFLFLVAPHLPFSRTFSHNSHSFIRNRPSSCDKCDVRSSR